MSEVLAFLVLDGTMVFTVALVLMLLIGLVEALGLGGATLIGRTLSIFTLRV